MGRWTTSAFFLPDGRCWACVHKTMDDVRVSPYERSEGWWDNGRRPRFSRAMDNAGRMSMGRWTRFHIARFDLRGGGTMDDVRVFSPNGRCWAHVYGMTDEVPHRPILSEGWWNDGRRPRFSRPMDDAKPASMGQWTRFMYHPMIDLSAGETMDDVRVFLARWTMLGVRPWDNGRGLCIAR